MVSVEIIKISKDKEEEPVKYSVEILKKEGESQQSVKKKLKDFKKELESTILFKHPVYGAFVSFSNPNRSKLIVRANFLWRNYARSTIREVGRKQGLEV